MKVFTGISRVSKKHVKIKLVLFSQSLSIYIQNALIFFLIHSKRFRFGDNRKIVLKFFATTHIDTTIL